MGSMFEVMKKVRADASGEEALAELGAAGAGAAPSGRFESCEECFEAGAETVEWDPRRVDAAVIAFHDRYSAVCEQFRSIRARLCSMNASGARRVIAVTSSIPQEGKSVSAVNLALTMAEGGEQRTLMVDADFRRSSIGHLLGIEPGPGLAELIRGDHRLPELLVPTPYPNLRLLRTGVLAGQSFSELLGSTATREALAALREQFDYTFLDTPPVNTVSDVSLLAPHCDGVILVVEMHRTPEPTAQQAVRTLQANNVKIFGCIVTRHDDRRAHYYDHYDSYYYRNG